MNHDRSGQYVAQITLYTELAIATVTRQSAGAKRTQDHAGRQFRRLHLGHSRRGRASHEPDGFGHDDALSVRWLECSDGCGELHAGRPSSGRDVRASRLQRHDQLKDFQERAKDRDAQQLKTYFRELAVVLEEDCRLKIRQGLELVSGWGTAVSVGARDSLKKTTAELEKLK